MCFILSTCVPYFHVLNLQLTRHALELNVGISTASLPPWAPQGPQSLRDMTRVAIPKASALSHIILLHVKTSGRRSTCTSKSGAGEARKLPTASPEFFSSTILRVTYSYTIRSDTQMIVYTDKYPPNFNQALLALLPSQRFFESQLLNIINQHEEN